jgi:hypothetical protein
MNKKLLRLMLVLGIFVSEIPVLKTEPVWACACCAERDTWERSLGNVMDYELELINSLRLSKGVFLNARIEDEDTLLSERKVTGKVIKSNIWQFSINKKSSNSEISTQVNFVADAPKKWQFARIDMTEWIAEENAVILYHEIIIPGTLKIGKDAEKLFGGVKTIPTQLVLQARSNNCLSKESFYHWFLKFKLGNKDVNGSGKIEEK